MRCFCFCKGNQFYANHNGRRFFMLPAHVVFASAKVINFMLITTGEQLAEQQFELFLLLQR